MDRVRCFSFDDHCGHNDCRQLFLSFLFPDVPFWWAQHQNRKSYLICYLAFPVWLFRIVLHVFFRFVSSFVWIVLYRLHRLCIWNSTQKLKYCLELPKFPGIKNLISYFWMTWFHLKYLNQWKFANTYIDSLSKLLNIYIDTLSRWMYIYAKNTINMYAWTLYTPINDFIFYALNPFDIFKSFNIFI